MSKIRKLLTQNNNWQTKKTSHSNKERTKTKNILLTKKEQTHKHQIKPRMSINLKHFT